jgi:hypothetical protein
MWHSVFALAALVVACDRNPFCPDDPPPPSGGAPFAVAPASPRLHPASMPDMDSGIAIEHGDPPPLAGDLRAEIDAFTTLEGCVSQHAQIDPLVGDAVRALGYDTLVRDACRIVDALKMKDASSCAAIASSGVQARCESLVAMAGQNADACPWIASTERTLGRDPVCLAIATHDPRICGASTTNEHATCEALATGDPKRCETAASDQSRFCAREFERQKRVMVAPEHDARDLKPPKAIVTIKGESGTADPEGSPVDVSAQIVQGVVVAANPTGGTRIDIAHDLSTSLHLPTRGGERTRFVASVVLNGSSGDPSVERFEIEGPKSPVIICPSSQCTATVTMAKGALADANRGTPFSLAIDGKVEAPSGKYSFHAQIDSFLRDVVTRTAMYAPRR